MSKSPKNATILLHSIIEGESEMPNASSSLPLSAMESPKPSPTPLVAFSSFFHQHISRLGSEISSRFEDAKRHLANSVTDRSGLEQRRAAEPPFAAVLHDSWQPKHAFDIALGADYVAKTMAGTAVYTVSNSNNEFVLISDPGSVKSLSLLCFRQEDAEALLAQVHSLLFLLLLRLRPLLLSNQS